MAKQQPSFSADLEVIQGEVEADVDTILELAKRGRGSSPSQPPPSEEVRPAPRQAMRSARGPRSRDRSPLTTEQRPPLLQNVTTRLSPETNSLLTEAALRQRLGKVTPASRQEIMEEALQNWLRAHGYVHAGYDKR